MINLNAIIIFCMIYNFLILWTSLSINYACITSWFLLLAQRNTFYQLIHCVLLFFSKIKIIFLVSFIWYFNWHMSYIISSFFFFFFFSFLRGSYTISLFWSNVLYHITLYGHVIWYDMTWHDVSWSFLNLWNN